MATERSPLRERERELRLRNWQDVGRYANRRTNELVEWCERLEARIEKLEAAANPQKENK